MQLVIATVIEYKMSMVMDSIYDIFLPFVISIMWCKGEKILRCFVDCVDRNYF